MPVPASIENLIEALNRRHGHKENNHHHGGYEQHHGHHHGHHKRSTTTASASPEEITTQVRKNVQNNSKLGNELLPIFPCYRLRRHQSPDDFRLKPHPLC